MATWFSNAARLSLFFLAFGGCLWSTNCEGDLTISTDPSTSGIISPGASLNVTCRLSGTYHDRSGLPLNFQPSGSKLSALNINVYQQQGLPVKVVNADTFATAQISSFTSEHAGEYSCVYTEFSGATKVVDLRRSLTLSLAEPPNVTKTQSVIHANISSSFQLACESRGNPAPLLQIVRQGQVLSSLPSGRRLVFSEQDLQVGSAGNYECQATNSMGSDSHTIQVIVQTPPTQALLNGAVNVPHTGTLQLSCNASAVPAPRITWTHNGSSLSQNVHTIWSSDATFSTLRIRNLTLVHSGRYRCVGENLLGSTQKDATVVVQVPPDAPQAVSVSQVETTAVVLSWTPQFDGNTPITRYHINITNTASSTIRSESTADSSASNVAISGLTPDQKYRFFVQAENAIGRSAFSESSAEIQTNPEAPPVPLNVQVTDIQPVSVVVTWGIPTFSPRQGSLLSFSVLSYQSNNISHSSRILASAPTATSQRVDGLQKGTNYTIVVFSHNRALMSNDSGAAMAKFRTATTVPGAPRLFDPDQVSANSLRLRWAVPSDDGGVAITEWHVQRNTPLFETKVPFNQLQYLFSNLQPGMDYRFEVSAINTNGRGAAANFSITTPTIGAPPQPLLPSVTFSTGQSLQITFPAGSHAVQEFVVRSRAMSSSDGDWTSITVPGSETQACLTNLQPGTNYFVRIAVRTNNLLSPFSPRLPAATNQSGFSAPRLTLLKGGTSILVARPPCSSSQFVVQYRLANSTTWLNTSASSQSVRLVDLHLNSTYYVRVAVLDGQAHQFSAVSAIQTPLFTPESSSSSASLTTGVIGAIAGGCIAVVIIVLVVVVVIHFNRGGEFSHSGQKRGWVDPDKPNGCGWYRDDSFLQQAPNNAGLSSSLDQPANGNLQLQNLDSPPSRPEGRVLYTNVETIRGTKQQSETPQEGKPVVYAHVDAKKTIEQKEALGKSLNLEGDGDGPDPGSAHTGNNGYGEA